MEATRGEASSVAILAVEAIRAEAAIQVVVIPAEATRVAVVIRAATDTRTRLITNQEDRV